MTAPRRRGIWLLPLALLAVGSALALVVVPAPSPNNSDPSSFSTGDNGTWALYQLSLSLGAHPEQLVGSGFASALKSGGTLVEAAPSVDFSRAQTSAIVDFLRRGGTLLYALRNPSVDAGVLAALGLARGASTRGGNWRELVPLRDHPRLLISSGRATEIRSSPGAAVGLLGPPHRPLAVAVSVARGEAIVLGSESPISNLYLRRHGNALFAALAMELGPGRRVVFDEIHHGYALGDGTEALLLGTPLGLAGLLVALLGLTWLASAGRRLGRSVPPPELVVIRGTDDHLEALARLYARTRDRRALAERYLAQLRQTTSSWPAHTDPGAAPLAEDLGRATHLGRELEAAAREGTSAKRLRELVREADALEDHLAVAPPHLR